MWISRLLLITLVLSGCDDDSTPAIMGPRLMPMDVGIRATDQDPTMDGFTAQDAGSITTDMSPGQSDMEVPIPDMDPQARDGAMEPPLDMETVVDEGTMPVLRPPEPGETPRFAFPIHPDDRLEINDSLILGVDHDPVESVPWQCTSYRNQAFPTCYDQHYGTDFILLGGFDAMDEDAVRVTAAAGGIVIDVQDGNYDRCQGDIAAGTIDCNGHPMRANQVAIEHPNGWTSWYLHLKRDSIGVRIGDEVECGDILGIAGSSGYSFTPHLHFEVHDPFEEVDDPYAGEITGPRSLWNDQGDPDELPGAQCHPHWTLP